MEFHTRTACSSALSYPTLPFPTLYYPICRHHHPRLTHPHPHHTSPCPSSSTLPPIAFYLLPSAFVFLLLFCSDQFAFLAHYVTEIICFISRGHSAPVATIILVIAFCIIETEVIRLISHTISKVQVPSLYVMENPSATLLFIVSLSSVLTPSQSPPSFISSPSPPSQLL